MIQEKIVISGTNILLDLISVDMPRLIQADSNKAKEIFPYKAICQLCHSYTFDVEEKNKTLCFVVNFPMIGDSQQSHSIKKTRRIDLRAVSFHVFIACRAVFKTPSYLTAPLFRWLLLFYPFHISSRFSLYT